MVLGRGKIKLMNEKVKKKGLKEVEYKFVIIRKQID